MCNIAIKLEYYSIKCYSSNQGFGVFYYHHCMAVRIKESMGVRCKVCSTHCSSVVAEISSKRVREERGERREERGILKFRVSTLLGGQGWALHSTVIHSIYYRQ